MAIKIEIKGLKNAKRRLNNYSDAQLKNADKAVGQAGVFLAGEVKQSISGHRDETKSVDTGRFLNSVENEKTGFLEAKVLSEVEYAQHLEEGTSRIPARRHFQNSAKRNTKKINEFVAEALKKERL